MRPLSLMIEGFTAFRERQEINFEPLELFVITGPTGAGKTSILDAIAFALYGEVPRIGSRKGTADVISLGTDRAAVEFEFRVGAYGRHRVARRISRRQGQSATLERQEGTEWVPVSTGGVTEANERIQELVGLDFDAFTRAVILPQGEFHRFLKGETADRRKVLFSLLGVSYFQRMGALARAKCADLEAGVKRTDDLLREHYVEATEEHLGQLRRAADTAASTRASISAALGTATEQAALAAEAGARLLSLEALTAGITGLGQTLRNSLASIREAEAAHDTAVKAVDDVSVEFDGARTSCERAETDLDTLCGEVGTLEDIATATAAAITLRDAAVEERTTVDEIGRATEATTTSRSQLDRALAEEATIVAKLDEAIATVSAAADRVDEARAAAEALERALDTARQRDTELAAADRSLAEINEQLPVLREQTTVCCDEFARAREQLEAYRRQHALAELAEGLGQGDPCPVCGVALAEAVAVDPDATEALAAARAVEQAAGVRREAGERAVTGAETKLGVAQSRHSECLEQLGAALIGYVDLSQLSDAASEAVDRRAACIAELDELGQARTGLAATRDSVRDSVSAARLRVTEQETTLEALMRSVAGIRERRDAAAAVLRDRFGEAGPDDAIDRLAIERARVVEATEAVTLARTARDRVAERHQEASTRVADAARRLTAIDLELTSIVANCATFAAQVPAASRGADIGQPPGLDGSRLHSAERIKTWSDAAGSALSEITAAVAVERDRASDAVLTAAQAHGVEAPDPELALSRLKESEQHAVIAATQADAAVGECERNLQVRDQMENQIKADRERIGVLATLGQELQNNRFGDYIIDETLSLLSAHASGELKRISGGRYSLRPAKGEFQVIDHANADESRSVKTLSGGETFLASLALALALSRHVGELAADGMGARLESVFIDEGFGTLDPATLDEVIDALERLRAEELVVGVISHVPELAQRIQSGLEVHQDGGRSRITAIAGI
ncbi:MAG: AAA family ATPase [Solirubrobacteraceae bacterium]